MCHAQWLEAIDISAYIFFFSPLLEVTIFIVFNNNSLLYCVYYLPGLFYMHCFFKSL